VERTGFLVVAYDFTTTLTEAKTLPVSLRTTARFTFGIADTTLLENESVLMWVRTVSDGSRDSMVRSASII
jgi:hypothetical protein